MFKLLGYLLTLVIIFALGFLACYFGWLGFINQWLDSMRGIKK